MTGTPFFYVIIKHNKKIFLSFKKILLNKEKIIVTNQKVKISYYYYD